ncbi:hypothetical protein [Kutzneria sp. CA-103260]|uniref:hypothetical protein n=1 Tax=Kutzneria sp. CA-103260 TaxID=2802641 RepID=UPI001BAE4511|nr:hypothetical protein [Kutzneria sp. CA-103260]QUQ69815.1 hypothetical protein JJ691_75790 [Kutzneria sp. CA-103260]
MDESEGAGPNGPVIDQELVTPRRRRWAGPFVGGVAVGALLLSVVWGLSQPKGPGPASLLIAATGGGATTSGKAAPTTFTLLGTFSLYGTSSTVGGACHGSGGYSDIADGASVTVYDAAGKVDAIGAITRPQSLGMSGCTFSIVVSAVPNDDKFYQVEITHRGKVTVTADDAKAGRVALTLGN